MCYLQNMFVFASQVSFRTSVHRQSFNVEVCVIDKNDNVPTFIEESMRGSVQLGLLKGTRTLHSDVNVLHNQFKAGSHSSVLIYEICWISSTVKKTCLMSPWKLQFNLNISINRFNNVANSIISVTRTQEDFVMGFGDRIYLIQRPQYIPFEVLSTYTGFSS